MADRSNRKFRHFILDGFTETKRFQSPQQGGTPKVVPERDRKGHGAALLNQLTALKAEAENARLAQEDAGFEEGIGIQVEFESFPDIELAGPPERLRSTFIGGIKHLPVKFTPEQ